MPPQRVLIIGATGMLGHALLRYLGKGDDIELLATARDRRILDWKFIPKLLAKIFVNIDAKNFASIDHVLSEVQPDVVINCIGIIKQSPLAHDPIVSISINALFPHQLALACKRVGSRLIHFSTDCVFSGSKGNYVEGDFPDADDLYGRTKFLGELHEPHCVTLRTSIIGHELLSRHGLIDWFINEKNKIKGYTQAIFTGFPTVEIAHIIADYIISNPDLSGLYHVSSYPISKYDLLKLVADKYGHKIKIEPYDDFICDRSLNSAKFRSATGYFPPSWEDLVTKMHDDFILNQRR